MFQRDYVLRLLQQLQEAIARIAARRDQSDLTEAASELDGVALQAYGMPLALIVSLPEDHLLRTITREQQPDAERLLLLVRLLYERARLGSPPTGGPPWARKALRLLAALGTRATGAALEPHRDALLQLVQEFEHQSPTPALLHDLWLACEALGVFARAEDKLYALADLEPDGHAPEGEAFYRRLLGRDDVELEDGGLPRDEVEDGLTRWMERARASG